MYPQYFTTKGIWSLLISSLNINRYAFVEFSNQSSVADALLLDGSQLCHQSIKVSRFYVPVHLVVLVNTYRDKIR